MYEKNKLSSSAERKAGALLSYAQVFLNVIVGLLLHPRYASAYGSKMNMGFTAR
ncbi:MAG: hypothetical protein L6V88_09415 [Anaerotruncus sp.]|nr:MAG: hypothetical protein L6V88_09415 [Anaerotruncus sp.]